MTEEWDKIKAEYVRGGTTYREISEKYGVRYSAVVKRALAERWTDDKRLMLSLKAKQNADALSKQHRISRFDSIADRLLDQIEEGIRDGSVSVVGKGWKDITGALKDMRDIIGIQTELDEQEQSVRIEKLRSEVKGQDGDEGVLRVVFADGLGEYGL